MGGGNVRQKQEEPTNEGQDEEPVMYPTAHSITQEDCVEDSELLHVVDCGGGNPVRRRRESALRVAGAATVSLVGAVPWAMALGVESLYRRGTGGDDQFAVRGVGWSFVSIVYNDVTNLSTLTNSYSNMRWSFPDSLSKEIPALSAPQENSTSGHQTLEGANMATANPLADGQPSQGEGTAGNNPSDSRTGPGLVALTIDDAPGDNPEAFSALLDVLKEFGARASFFCTTDTLEACGGAMKPLVHRALREGHELCNHGCADRPYHLDSAESFEAELVRAQTAIDPFIRRQAQLQKRRDEAKKKKALRSPQSSESTTNFLGKSWVDVADAPQGGGALDGGAGAASAEQDEPEHEQGKAAAAAAAGAESADDEEDAEDEDNADIPFLSSTHKRWKWFRPPSGMMSTAMASVLQAHGYSCVLGDVFSNDVFVGGDHSGSAAGPRTVAYHVDYCVKRTRAGSVVIFHVPKASSRLMAVDVVRSYLQELRTRGGSGCVAAAAAERPSEGGLLSLSRRGSLTSTRMSFSRSNSGSSRLSYTMSRVFYSSSSDSAELQTPAGPDQTQPNELDRGVSEAVAACSVEEGARKELRCVTLSELANAVEFHKSREAEASGAGV